LAIVMKISPGLPFVQADGEVALVAGDAELVGDGAALVRQARRCGSDGGRRGLAPGRAIVPFGWCSAAAVRLEPSR
jgi:hypothetical protein